MSDKIYIYDHGSCRGHEFTKKTIIDDVPDFLAFVEKGLDLPRDGEEMEQLCDMAYETYGNDGCTAILGLILGSPFGENHSELVERFTQLKEGKAVAVELEESVIGIAYSKEDARIASATFDVEGW